MAWTNFHSHTHYCDGTNAPEDYLEAAKKLGFVAYGFSTHGPLPYASCKWAISKHQLENYFSEITKLKETSELQVYLSLELDYIPLVWKTIREEFELSRLDYSLYSIHFVDFLENGEPWEVDGTIKQFDEGLNQIFGGDIQAAVKRYFELSREMVGECKPDIIGHMDKIKRHNLTKPYFDESAPWFRKEIEKTLECIKANGTILEVNTRGLYKKICHETYPGDWTLKKALEMDVPIMLNSDAHLPRELPGNFIETALQLKSIGFKKLWAMWDNEFQPFSFDEKGIVI